MTQKEGQAEEEQWQVDLCEYVHVSTLNMVYFVVYITPIGMYVCKRDLRLRAIVTCSVLQTYFVKDVEEYCIESKWKYLLAVIHSWYVAATSAGGRMETGNVYVCEQSEESSL